MRVVAQVVFRSLTLGEVLEGDRMAESLYDLRFQGASTVQPVVVVTVAGVVVVVVMVWCSKGRC